MKVVYIAGPYRAPTRWKIRSNVFAASELGLAVAKLGASPLIPHANTDQMEGVLPDQFFLDATMELLRRCDAMILATDWQLSEGTQAEIREASRLGIPIFKDLGSLNAWLDKQKV